MKTLNIDGECTVVENLGLLLRQVLPTEQHGGVGKLIGQLAMSLHVANFLSTPWNALTVDERGEILRETLLAAEAAMALASRRQECNEEQ
jgi:hypothetical protein